MTKRPIGIVCRTCLGHRRTQAGVACSPCAGTGWIIKPLDEIPPEQLTSLRRELREIPLDSDSQHSLDSTREHLTKTLTRRWIESISFPAADNSAIILHGKRDSIRIHPEFAVGKFAGLNAEPVIEEVESLELRVESEDPL